MIPLLLAIASLNSDESQPVSPPDPFSLFIDPRLDELLISPAPLTTPSTMGPVTELALLQFKDTGRGLEHPEVRDLLQRAKLAMQDYTGKTFYYLRQVENPNVLYVLGEWASLDSHMHGFLPSQVNQDIVKALAGDVDVSWLMHLNMPPSDIQIEAPVLSIVLHYIDASNEQGFRESYAQNRTSTSEGGIASGWRVESYGNGEKAFVMFAPWKDVEQHMAFAKTDGFKKYTETARWVRDAHAKHVKVFEV